MSRTRNYACVLYPESAPEDWRNILVQHFVPAFVSPLHNEDINPTGECKKEHYHIMIMFDNVKTAEQAKEIFDSIGGVGCEVVKSLRGYARYLCHLDNPDKAQYKIEDVQAYCGADYNGVIGLAIDKYKAIGEMIDFCKDNDIVSYAYLIEFAREARFDWFRVLCDNGSYVIKEYLKTRYFDERHKEDVE